MELISQDDINNLLNAETEDTRVESVPPESEASESQESDSPPDEEDPDQPEEAVIVEEIEDPAAKDNGPEDEFTIKESESVDVQDCLISQETIDDLIENFDIGESSEPVVLDEEPVPDSGPVTESDDSALPEDTKTDDTEDFLKPDPDVTVLDFDDEGEDDVSQEDIDALLLEPDDDEDDEDDILISQDDIDTLLMAADQEDEDVLGDLTDNEFDTSLDDDLEDEDLLESDSLDDDDVDDGVDQVVLEGDDEEPVKKSKKKKSKARSQWYKSKLVIACASALVVLGITIPLAYFIFFSGEPDQVSRRDSVAKLTVDTSREIEVETVDVNVRKPLIDQQAGNMVLKDFVVLSPDASKDMAYVTADISIDYSDQRAYHEIVNNLSFYRDLIYDSINKSLVSGKRDQVTEADILWIVEAALKKVLPGHYINRISFKSFKAS